jgi:DNA-directed RNA polymerase subunit beta
MQNSYFFLPDFMEIQRQSYFSFLEKGILEEFHKRNPMMDADKNIEIFFYPEHYKLTKPVYNLKQAVFLQKSYVSKLYVPVQITYKKEKKIFLKWALIAHLPLMTNRGHFLLNGSARIIVNQLIRSPGIYFRESFYEIYANAWTSRPESVLKRFYADIIPLKGTWLRLEMDKEFCLWARIKKGPKIPLLWLLLGMGLTEQTIFSKIQYPNFLLKSFEKEFEDSNSSDSEKPMKYAYVSNAGQAWTELAQLFNLKKNKVSPMELGRLWLFKKFMNPRTYDLGKTGRLSLNKKLNLNVSVYQTTLTAEDLLTATNSLVKVAEGIVKTDDIDHLKNRRVLRAGELIQTQLSLGLIRLEKSLLMKTLFEPAISKSKKSKSKSKSVEKNVSSLSLAIRGGASRPSLAPRSAREGREGEAKTPALASSYARAKLGAKLRPGAVHNQVSKEVDPSFCLRFFFNSRAINGVLKEFFGTNPLSQFMDQINPLAELTHKRRLTSLGPGGVSRDTATLSVRGIHPSHYGRICPIETPEGKNTGLVNSITAYSRVNSLGLIETPFYKIFKGQIQKERGVFYLSAEYEENLKLATPDLGLSGLNFLPKYAVPVRYKEKFVKMSRESVSLIGVSPLQMISVATSFIPFLEHDDANRALMGSNMQRQAVPLMRPERPWVGTGLEARAVSDSGHALTSQNSGYVFSVNGFNITLYH